MRVAVWSERAAEGRRVACRSPAPGARDSEQSVRSQASVCALAWPPLYSLSLSLLTSCLSRGSRDWQKQTVKSIVYVVRVSKTIVETQSINRRRLDHTTHRRRWAHAWTSPYKNNNNTRHGHRPTACPGQPNTYCRQDDNLKTTPRGAMSAAFRSNSTPVDWRTESLRPLELGEDESITGQVLQIYFFYIPYTLWIYIHKVGGLGRVIDRGRVSL